MDFVDNNYYKHIRILLYALGLWPYDKTYFRCVKRVVLFSVFISGIIFQLTTLVTMEYKFVDFLEISTYIAPVLGSMIKYLTVITNAKDLKGIFDQIQLDWHLIRLKEEWDILEKYASNVKNIFLGFLASFYLGYIIIVLQQCVPIVLDIFVPRNESRSRTFPILLEYFIDQQKYYFVVFFHLNLFTFVSCAAFIATEMIHNICVQHSSGLFKVACYRVENIVTDSVLHISSLQRYLVRERIIRAVHMHRRALNLCKAMAPCFMTNYIAMYALGVVVLSVNIYRVTRVPPSEEMQAFVFVIILIFLQTGYGLYNNFLGQQIINHSTESFSKIYETSWHLLHPGERKLLLFFMQRCTTHSQFSLAGIYVPSFEGFVTVSGMIISYGMFMHSTL